MADSTPLLSQPSSEPPRLQKHLPSLDSTIEKCIGELSWSQFFQSMLVSLAWFFDAQQTFIAVFTDADPKSWHCKTQLNISTESCDICLLPRDSWEWDFPRQASTISEFSLQCSGSFITGLPSSAFFIGCLIGGLLLATLADSSLGRKTMLFLSCLVMALSTLLTAVFSTNVWIYSALRFLTGFGRATIGTCALVLSTELVGRRWRGQMGVMGFVFFTLGFLSLPAMAYANRGSSWRNLYVWTSVPTIFYSVAVHFLVCESPRWLFVRGRKEDAMKNMVQISNNQNITTMSFSSIIMAFEEETWNVDLYSAIKILVEKKWAFRRLSAVMAIGFGTGMVYYGMPLALGNLDFNLYLSVVFNALSELPSSLVTFYLVEKLNRKSSLLFFTILSGICSIMSVLKGNIWTKLQIGFELLSFFSACTAFDLLLIFTIELFPTCVRNSAVAMVRQALVFGGVFSPVLAAVGRGSNGFVSYGVFGMVIGCFGLFAVCLPETRGRAVCDTMDEEEHKDKSASCNHNGICAANDV